MNRSDVCIVAFMYLFSGIFYYLNIQLPEAAQHYPTFVIGLLVFLTTIQFITMLVNYAKTKEVFNDFPSLFAGFLPKQFFYIFIACLCFFPLSNFIGFYLTAFIYMLCCLKFFHIENKYIALSIIVLLCLVYVVFSSLLNVPLPNGELLEQFL